MATGKKTFDRVLSRAGACSRTEARAAIEAGRAAVNGRTVRDPDTWIDLVRDRVTLDGASLQVAARQMWLLHKPAGYVTTADDERGRNTVYALLPPGLPWLAPVGRLDQETSGLLLFTNDTVLANCITDPACKLAKTYVAHCRGVLGDEALRQLAHGVALADGITSPARVRQLAADHESTTIELVITEGRNRQVRRMIEAVGSHVLALHRTAVGPLHLGDEVAGRARQLTAAEVAALREAVRTRHAQTAIRKDRRRPRPRTNRGTSP